MEIAIKYPRKKFIEVKNIAELQKELSLLMIEKFDIKNRETKPFVDIKVNVFTKEITKLDFSILMDKNSIIIPTEISQCKI